MNLVSLMSGYLYASSTKEYTPETHPWRDAIFLGWPPGTFRLDGRPYCPKDWILSKKDERPPKTLAVQGSKKACEALIAQWGAKVEWQEANTKS